MLRATRAVTQARAGAHRAVPSRLLRSIGRCSADAHAAIGLKIVRVWGLSRGWCAPPLTGSRTSCFAPAGRKSSPLRTQAAMPQLVQPVAALLGLLLGVAAVSAAAAAPASAAARAQRHGVRAGAARLCISASSPLWSQRLCMFALLRRPERAAPVVPSAHPAAQPRCRPSSGRLAWPRTRQCQGLLA